MTSSGSATSGLELAAVLAQLGLDVRQPERRVDLLLGLAGQRLPGRVVEDPVLGNVQALADRHLAQVRRCGLAAGEVLEQVPERRRRDDAQVDAKPGLGDAARAAASAALGHGDHLQSVEGLRHRRHVVRRDDDVEVLDVVGLAARRPRDLGAHDGRVRAQPLEDRVADRHRAREHDACAGRPFGLRVERRDQRLLGLRAEPLQLPDLAGARGRAQRFQRVDAELLVQPAGALGPEALELRHRHEPRRELRPQLLGGRRAIRTQPSSMTRQLTTVNIL